jgi:integrase/recombinase XerC/integrase/recombinase XerD
MKNSPTPGEDTVSPGWRGALTLHEQDLQRRGAAPRTREAYAFDTTHFAAWASQAGFEPEAVDLRVLRRYAALLGERRLEATSVARKLAALRSLFRTLREHDRIAHNPVELMPSPKRARKLPRVLTPEEVTALLDRIPAATPLDVRDRAMFELAYACGLRAEELVQLNVGSVDYDGEEVRVEGKGSKTRIVPAGEPALRAIARYVERARPALSDGAARRRCSSRSPAGGSRHQTSGGAYACGRGMLRFREASTRTPSGTRSRPTCLTAGPTCGPSRRCSDMRVSPRLRSTLG